MDERQEAVERLKRETTEENLWKCIVAYQEYPFRTISGLPFYYTLKKGRNGELTRELWVDRRENSKSLAWSSVKLAFYKVLKGRINGERLLIERPKALGDIRGVSYICPIFSTFGLIEVLPKEKAIRRGQEPVLKQ